MRLHRWLALGVPVFPWLGNGLIGAGFILAPQRHSCRFRQLVGVLDQAFFSAALGSCTVTVPALRTRMAVPVGHQVRVLPKRYPASWSTSRTVETPTCGNISRRKAF